MKPLDPASPYFIDFPGRVRALQAEMARAGIDVYLGSRLRTLSWLLDTFCPWRSFVVVPSEGPPAAFTFVIDAARVADFIKDLVRGRKGRVGIESGMSNYLPEGNLTHYEFERFHDALAGSVIFNAHDLVDRLSLVKDAGTIARFREASRIVDVGHQAVFDALRGGGWKGRTETEIAGLAALAMRKAGSEWEWSFTGGNEIASGYRTGFTGGACTPASRRELRAGEPLMVDIHAMFMLGLGDHSHNYLIAPASDRQLWHARNFTDIDDLTLRTYRAGLSPSELAEKMIGFAESRGFADYMVPGFEHGIGLMGDEWRIGMNDGPFPYWTNPDHRYRESELLICAMQYACPEENIGFRYENPIVIRAGGCEHLSKFPLSVDVVS